MKGVAQIHCVVMFSRLIDWLSLSCVINQTETNCCSWKRVQCFWTQLNLLCVAGMEWNLQCLSVQITSKCLFVCLFFTLSPLSSSLSQPKGRAGGRVCCFSAGDDEEDGDTWSLSSTDPAAYTLKEWHTRTLPHKYILTGKKKTHTDTHTLQNDNKPTQNEGWRFHS